MKTRSAVVQVLLIEDNIIDARFVSADFQMRGDSQFFLHTAPRVDDAAKILQTQHIDVILLDLFLKETQGLETVSAVGAIAPDTPVVVLTSRNDEELALQALKHGAQDYLIKGTVDIHLMFRAIRYAIERKQGELDKRFLEERSVQMQVEIRLGDLPEERRVFEDEVRFAFHAPRFRNVQERPDRRSNARMASPAVAITRSTSRRGEVPRSTRTVPSTTTHRTLSRPVP